MLAGLVRHAVAEADLLEQLGRPSPRRSCSAMPPARIGQHHVLDARQARHEVEGLEHDADRLAPVRASAPALEADDVEVAEADRSARRA